MTFHSRTGGKLLDVCTRENRWQPNNNAIREAREIARRWPYNPGYLEL